MSSEVCLLRRCEAGVCVCVCVGPEYVWDPYMYHMRAVCRTVNVPLGSMHGCSCVLSLYVLCVCARHCDGVIGALACLLIALSPPNL